jgi:hypothetical protein
MSPATGPGIEGWIRNKVWVGTMDALIYLFGSSTDLHNNLRRKSIPLSG